MAGRVWGTTTCHDLGGNDPLVGRSVPNFEFEDGTTIGEHMRHGKALLLDFSGCTSLEALASEYGDQIQYRSGVAKKQLGLSALLVRPDGIVAWASTREAEEQAVRQAAGLWFTPAS